MATQAGPSRSEKAEDVKRKKNRAIPKPKILRNMGEEARQKSPLATWRCDTLIVRDMGKSSTRIRTPKDGADRCSCRGREYRCIGCGRWRPWCEGGADDTAASAQCDRCWNAAEARAA